MAYLHNNKDQFQDAIELAYEQTGVMAQAIEKDYAKVPDTHFRNAADATNATWRKCSLDAEFYYR